MSSNHQAAAPPDASRISEIRKRNSINTAKFRARQSASIAHMKKRVNEILTQLNRPLIDFTKKKTEHVLKGKARPIHMPPEEERKTMTHAQLSEWKAVQRKKRKASQARLRRKREDEMGNNLRKLWNDLERQIAQKEEREVHLLPELHQQAKSAVHTHGNCASPRGEDSERKMHNSAAPCIEHTEGNVDEMKPAAADEASQAHESDNDDALLFLAQVASKHPDDSPEDKQEHSNCLPNLSPVSHQPFSSDMMF
ncbi:hypothetical protein ACHAWO_009385 [Cyclotella atomus]|jgi:hypothetical protein|uniref:Uncharacterized protein n=1 Tax=Cyclotella atomus TaxID=382360 RepID=A0ABD3N6F7_9STRA